MTHENINKAIPRNLQKETYANLKKHKELIDKYEQVQHKTTLSIAVLMKSMAEERLLARRAGSANNRATFRI